MSVSHPRPCPLCGGEAGDSTFPYTTLFNSVHFHYLRCRSCSTVFVDPLPDSKTFSKMYAKDAYHDIHYKEKNSDAYSASARLLRQHMSPGSLVLDYGCGLGDFLKAIKSSGFVPYGVEFDSDAGRFARQNVGCEVLPVNEFHELLIKPNFDVIHLGDVLEHLSDPAATLGGLLDHLRPGGIVFVEGPLETNPSPVYWAARLYGIIKLVVKPGFIPNDPPLHLIRTEAKAQLAFFKAFAISPVFWRVYETGWPYAGGGVVKRAIARLAVILSGRRLFNITFGNRFEGLFVKLGNKSN